MAPFENTRYLFLKGSFLKTTWQTKNYQRIWAKFIHCARKNGVVIWKCESTLFWAVWIFWDFISKPSKPPSLFLRREYPQRTPLQGSALPATPSARGKALREGNWGSSWSFALQFLPFINDAMINDVHRTAKDREHQGSSAFPLRVLCQRIQGCPASCGVSLQGWGLNFWRSSWQRSSPDREKFKWQFQLLSGLLLFLFQSEVIPFLKNHYTVF